jgi:GalNAc5-diNAcBac-PP-undecaprenol beta-1,3-glucosyltransferase
MAAYNRATTLERAVKSVFSQTYPNMELIIVDDGSTDNTREVLARLDNPAIRIVYHEKNKGVTAAKNSGLNEIRGEWFTTLDSDDEMIPEAIETMMNIPLNVDPDVTAVSCNCLDTTTKGFSGKGMSKDQYFDVETLMTACTGEFWGITKTSLLGADRFNEKLNGFEDTVWYKIDDKAKRYYVHKALRIYHTEGDDRVMKTKYNYEREIKLYENLIREEHFLDKTKKYQPEYHYFLCKSGLITMRSSNRKSLAEAWYKQLDPGQRGAVINMSYRYKGFSVLMKNLVALKFLVKPYLGFLLKK